MEEHSNHLGQKIGFPLEDWMEPKRPSKSTIQGSFSKIEPLDPSCHAEDLYHAYSEDSENKLWTYLPYGPFSTFEKFLNWVNETCCGPDPFFYAIIDLNTSRAIGVASYLNIKPSFGLIEVGHINYSPALQKTRIATESVYLMMRHAFEELGYRRYEWKCDALNSSSRNAALRLGFIFEGIFRQAAIYKNRNRDTAWFSIIDSEWPRLKEAFECWLNPKSFNDQGQQAQSLAALINSVKSNDKIL